jgi:O-antigen/teichoic acid export membrane protein
MVLFFTIGIWIAIGHSNLKQVITLFIIASTISIMVGGVNLWRLCRRVCQNGDSPGNESGMEHILSISWPMWITNLLLFVLAQADLWVLGIFHVEGGVALYGAGSRLAILILTPLLIINAVIPPHVAELHTKKRKAEFEQIMRSTATISGIIGFFLFILLGIFGKPILGIIFGEYYRNAATVLLLLSFGQFVTVWAGSCGIALMMTGHQILMMVITVVSGVISILLAIALVKQYGPEGVAFATTMGLVFQSLAMVTAVKVKVDVWTQMYTPLRALG